MYDDILTLIKYICGLIKSARCWFKEYIKTMTLNVGFKQCNTYPSLLYRVNELGNLIFIVYIDDTLTIGDKPSLVDMIELIKK